MLHMLCRYSSLSVARFQVTVLSDRIHAAVDGGEGEYPVRVTLGGSISCLVNRALMVLDFGRVIYLT